MKLLTRSDFDGLGCAVLLKEIGLITDIKFVHPKDIQDGKVEVTSEDILANIPYAKGCALWFDHHSSEDERNSYGRYEGLSDPSALSAASVIYHYYGGEKKFTNPLIKEFVMAIDKADSANFTADEILQPKGWVLLSFITDSRTGLGRYKDFSISNYQLMMNIIEYCRTKTIDEILADKDVQERVTLYFHQDKLFREMVKTNTKIYGKVAVLDLRNQKEIYTGNRFLLYSLYPDQNISLQLMWGLQEQNVVITCGHSIINRTSHIDVGSLMLKYGGGGHKKAGSCQVEAKKADEILQEIIKKMNKNH